MLTRILCIVTPVTAFAQNAESTDEGFHLELDASDTSEQVYEINSIEFRVLPVLIRGGVNASKREWDIMV